MEDRIRTAERKTKERQMKKKMKAIWDLWNNIKYANLSIIGITEEEREKWAEDVFGWKFPKPKEGTR